MKTAGAEFEAIDVIHPHMESCKAAFPVKRSGGGGCGDWPNWSLQERRRIAEDVALHMNDD